MQLGHRYSCPGVVAANGWGQGAGRDEGRESWRQGEEARQEAWQEELQGGQEAWQQGGDGGIAKEIGGVFEKIAATEDGLSDKAQVALSGMKIGLAAEVLHKVGSGKVRNADRYVEMAAKRHADEEAAWQQQADETTWWQADETTWWQDDETTWQQADDSPWWQNGEPTWQKADETPWQHAS